MKKLFSIVLSLLMVMTLLTGCGNGNKSSGTRKGDADTLYVANDSDAISLDPMGTNDNASSKVLVQIYEGLFELNDQAKEVPLLAESYDKVSDTEYVFHLRKGVKFHNGDEMKASDVVFSLKRACEAPNVKHLFNTIDEDSIKADDDYTVRFNLKFAYPGIIASLMHPGGAILCQKFVEEAGDNFGTSTDKVCGTGPFKLDEWSKANVIKLSRFEDYYGEKAKMAKVEMKIIPEPTNRLVELQTGGADIVYELQPMDVEKIEKDENLVMLKSDDYGTTYLGFNTQKAPFDNPKVRQAIAYAIDIPDLIPKVWLGLGKAASNSMPPTLVYSIGGETKAKERDVEKAKALLAEAGFPDGFDTTISTNERKQRVDMATIIKEQLKDVGINVTINVMEWSAYNDLLKNGKQDMFEIAWISDTPDPDAFLFPCFHSSAMGEGGNYCWLNDSEMDKMLDDARMELDTDKRAEIYKKAQEYILDQQIWIPQYWAELTAATSKNVEGFEMNHFGFYKLSKVSVKSAENK